MGQFIEVCPEIKQLLANATRIEKGMYGGYRVRKDYSYLNSRFWVPGLVLVGDSACFVDPIFSSESISRPTAGCLRPGPSRRS